MKAVRIARHGGPEVMELVELPTPEPGPGKVRIRVEACGLNYSDIMIRNGNYLDPMPMPLVLGREFCGRVDAVGSGADGWQPGMRVVGSAPAGALAEYVVVAPAGLIPCPEAFDAAQGAAFLVQGLTAIHCLTDCGKLEPGETVLVHAAAGGVGTLAVQMAKALGANVLGTASSAEKCRLIESLGATAINYTQPGWVDEVRKHTGGAGAALILESVGGEICKRSFNEALATFGRMVIFGCASGEAATFTNIEVLGSNKSLIGYYLGTYFPKHMDRVVDGTGRLMAMMQLGKVQPHVGGRFALADAAKAFDLIESRKSTGKIVVMP